MNWQHILNQAEPQVIDTSAGNTGEWVAIIPNGAVTFLTLTVSDRDGNTVDYLAQNNMAGVEIASGIPLTCRKNFRFTAVDVTAGQSAIGYKKL